MQSHEKFRNILNWHRKKEEQQIYVDALAEYKAALELDPERIDVYQKVVLLDYKMGQFSEFETQANALLTKMKTVNRIRHLLF